MLVVLAIITIITTIAITSQSTFNKTLILKNTAYDVALSIRSAESFGIGSRVSTSGATNAAYGVHFTKATNSFIVFADTSPGDAGNDANHCHGLPPSGDATAPDALYGNCVYTSGADVLVQTYTLGNGISVSNLCTSANGGQCSNSGLTTLDIVFARPNPNPFMSTNGTWPSGWKITKACITLTSAQGGTSLILVSDTGAIVANVPASSCQ